MVFLKSYISLSSACSVIGFYMDSCISCFLAVNTQNEVKFGFLSSRSDVSNVISTLTSAVSNRRVMSCFSCDFLFYHTLMVLMSFMCLFLDCRCLFWSHACCLRLFFNIFDVVFVSCPAECDSGEGGGRFLGEGSLCGGVGKLSLWGRLCYYKPADPTWSGLSRASAHLRPALPLPLQSCESVCRQSDATFYTSINVCCASPLSVISSVEITPLSLQDFNTIRDITS